MQWRYFLRFGDDDLSAEGQAAEADAGRAAMYRLPVGAPVSLLEALMGEGVWQVTDVMWRAKYLGSDYEFTEITPERAEELMRRWVEIGRLDAMPSQEWSITAELAEYLTGLDAQAQAQWRDVARPPGAEDVNG